MTATEHLDQGPRPQRPEIQRAIIRVVITGLRNFKEPVPQRMIDFVEGRADDPGPLPDPEKYRNRRRSWWQRMLGR
ncbi:hypothetical protein FK268_01640 [Tsukamurella sputi]|uniref:Uncharacterized protein n=1 Tax=Tsukamurella sputi TaxID=2591848 RepID=A0A5C5RSH7_9ACTN|nr:hypothetical protein [Tsukamurella sputi]TWS25979.1 hypothetical protein FK268_01640 [Tsukamurella sputi]